MGKEDQLFYIAFTISWVCSLIVGIIVSTIMDYDKIPQLYYQSPIIGPYLSAYSQEYTGFIGYIISFIVFLIMFKKDNIKEVIATWGIVLVTSLIARVLFHFYKKDFVQKDFVQKFLNS